jgi:hypothetical protein
MVAFRWIQFNRKKVAEPVKGRSDGPFSYQGSAGVADDKVRGQNNLLDWTLGMGDAIEEDFDGRFPDRAGPDADRRERRSHQGGVGDIVEANDAKVSAGRSTFGLQAEERPEGHDVVITESRRRRFGQLQQRAHSFKAAVTGCRTGSREPVLH